MKRNVLIRLILLTLLGVVLFSAPSSALAQDTNPPPVLSEDEGISDDDILVFEPELFVEFPFAQGFKLSFNFGFSLEVPRRLMLVDNDVLNFFLRFRSYIIPADPPGSTTPIPTPTPEVTPTP